jgi:hypothetical protein
VHLTYDVEYLNSALRVSDSVPATQVNLNGFTCELTSKQLTAVPDDEFADVDSARTVLEPALRAWEAKSEIVDGLPFRFKFAGSRMETVGPREPGVVHAQASLAIGASITATATVERSHFPEPDPAITAEGPATAQLRARWRQVQQGKEPFHAAAYWILRASPKVETYPGVS